MKEKANNQQDKVHLPPTWCSGICRNAMNEICIENCAIKRDCSAFEPKKNLTLMDLPKFPSTANMTKEEKFTSVTIYLAKVVDYLQGEPIDQNNFVKQPKRRGSNHPDQKVVQIKDLLPALTELVPTAIESIQEES